MNTPDDETKKSIDEAVEEINDNDAVDVDTETVEEPEALTLEATNDESKPQRPSRRKRKLIIAGAVAALFIGVIAAVPFLRYGALGVVMKKDITLKVVDQSSGKPVTAAKVALGRNDATTDKNGVAAFKNVAVGDYYVSIEKNHYENWSGSVLVPIFSGVKDKELRIKATGRSVRIEAKNAISGQPVGGAVVAVSDAEAITDTAGVATLVVGVGRGKLDGVIKTEGYVDHPVTVDTEAADDQKIEAKLVPAGRVYYLSKATGKINVMSSYLDGSDAQVAVQATGREFDQDTMIMASRDWKYVMLMANRDGRTQPHLIKTSDNSLVKIDNDDATFQPIGWIGNSFIYVIQRQRSVWQPGQTTIKLYNADSGKTVVVEESKASGTSYHDYLYQYFSYPVIVGPTAYYSSSWSASSGDVSGQKTQLISLVSDGSRRVIKQYDASSQSVSGLRAVSPTEAQVALYDSGTGAITIHSLSGDRLSATGIDEVTFNNATYPTYLVSPSGNRTAWHEARDGKYLAFVGDASGKNAKELPVNDFKVYGWFTDNYVLLAKNGSELYVYAVDATGAEPLKITNYHKPVNEFMGMGYGGAV